MEVRSAVGGARQLAIEGGAVAVLRRVLLVARVPLEGESASDRVESDVAAGVVDLRLRRGVARQSHGESKERKKGNQNVPAFIGIRI